MNISTTPTHYLFYQNEKREKIELNLPAETPVSLTVNGEVWLSFMCTPQQEESLAAGFLFNEGIIENSSEIADIRLCEHGDNVDIWLNHAAEKPAKWTRTSCCTGGVTSVEPRASIGLARQKNDLVLSPKQIPFLLKMLDEHQKLYRQTGGIHTSILTDGAEKTIAAEDIGRHNTLDKIAGIKLMQNLSFEQSILLTTGRVSSEMMQKAIRLGVSIVISRTSPSSVSVELAEKAGITLIGYAKRHRFNLYTHAERIVEEDDNG